MRLAQPSDHGGAARVVNARCDWLEPVGLPSWGGARDDLVARCDDLDRDEWALDDEVAGVVGQTVVQREGSMSGWADEERAEQVLYLSGPVSDLPAAKALWPGSLMAWWRSTWPRGGACRGAGSRPVSGLHGG